MTELFATFSLFNILTVNTFPSYKCHLIKPKFFPAFDFCFFKKSDLNSTVVHIMGVKMEITPSKVNAPIGSQVLFTCKYWSSTTSPLFISVDSLNVFDVKETRFDDGAQLTFHYVVSCNQQTVRCIVRNKNDFEVGRINVLVSPGLSIMKPVCISHK